jgi:hypothetical protein
MQEMSEFSRTWTVAGARDSGEAGGRQKGEGGGALSAFDCAVPPAYLATGAADAGRARRAVVADLATARERGRPQGARSSEPTGAPRGQQAGEG